MRGESATAALSNASQPAEGVDGASVPTGVTALLRLRRRIFFNSAFVFQAANPKGVQSTPRRTTQRGGTSPRDAPRKEVA